MDLTHQDPWLGCGELETGSAVASLEQGLTALGTDVRPWAVGRVEGGHGGGPAGTVRAGDALCPDPARLALSNTHLA